MLPMPKDVYCCYPTNKYCVHLNLQYDYTRKNTKPTNNRKLV